ncbi:MAG TPA: carboxypeptidase-like regulatory domain-containing protein [Stenomitos sp.]
MKRLGKGSLLHRLLKWPAVTSLGLLSLTTMIAGVALAEMPPSGIQGKVLLGPTCPVMRIGQDCGAQPYQAKLAILNEQGDVVSCIETKADGSFAVNLPPGNYRIQSGSGVGSPPFLKEQPSLRVTPNQMTDVTLQFDSGIR